MRWVSIEEARARLVPLERDAVPAFACLGEGDEEPFYTVPRCLPMKGR